MPNMPVWFREEDVKDLKQYANERGLKFSAACRQLILLGRKVAQTTSIGQVQLEEVMAQLQGISGTVAALNERVRATAHITEFASLEAMAAGRVLVNKLADDDYTKLRELRESMKKNLLAEVKADAAADTTKRSKR